MQTPVTGRILPFQRLTRTDDTQMNTTTKTAHKAALNLPIFTVAEKVLKRGLYTALKKSQKPSAEEAAGEKKRDRTSYEIKPRRQRRNNWTP